MITKNIKVNKELFLESIDEGFLFYKFVIPDLTKIDSGHCENTYNPFYDDRNPSFSVYYDADKERWLFKDHGNSPNGDEYYGDVFDFAKRYYDSEGLELNFRELMLKMADDLHIDVDAIADNEAFLNKYEGYSQKEGRETHQAWSIGFDLLTDEDSKCMTDALSYFIQFGITEKILRSYNVKSVRKYLQVDKSGELQKKYNKNLVIAYENVNFAKLYCPHPKSFWYVGRKPKDFIFGYNQILNRNRREKCYTHDLLIITGGEKDVLTLASLGYDAVCFNSETASPPKEASESLFHWYKCILVMYDNDSTGIEKAKKIAAHYKEAFNINAFSWTEELKESGGKDISDYIKLKLDVDFLKQQIKNCTIGFDKGTIKDKRIDAESAKAVTISSSLSPSQTLPISVHDNLPKFLKGLCNMFDDPIDKDLVLLSVLGVASSCFPKVKGVHDGKKVATNIYLFISAPASSGKGVMGWARDIGIKIQHFLKKQDALLFAKSSNEQKAKSEEDKTKYCKPEKPVLRSLFIPANTSVSRMIEFLGANQDFGVIFQTEADTLTNTLKSDWGDFSEVLRCAFHHETVTLARRTNNEFIEIEKPHLSVVLSGTPDQINRLVGNVENGFFSRFMFYDFNTSLIWKDQFKEQDSSLEIAFDEAADIMLKYWQMQMGSRECVIYLRNDLKDRLNDYFSDKMMTLYGEHGEAIVANVKRTSLVCYRIAMLIKVFRILEKSEKLPETADLTADDLNVALGIVDTLLSHLQCVFKRLEDASRTSKLNSQQRTLYHRLPLEFNRSQYDGVANELSIKYKTAERYLSVFIKKELIAHPSHGNYLKM